MRRSDHYCWLTHCREIGAELVVGGAYRIVLCVEHRAELEATSQYGYSQADPPARGGRKVEEWQDLKITTWWPWELCENQGV
jgi:hypothetical protein